MKEVVTITDGYTLNPGDLDWEWLSEFGTVHYFDRTDEDEVARRCQESTIIVTNKTVVNAETIRLCRNLKLIAVTATGFNIIDVNAARDRNILVCNVPGYGTDSVAQHTFALILELSNHVGENSRSVQRGDWSTSKDFCYTLSPISELAGKTIGIVGYGSIGQKVAEIASAFGMNVIYSRNSPDSGSVSIEDLFQQSDIVSLHCPLSSKNAGFVNHTLLSRMKRTAVLINTSRGGLINERDLAESLTSGVIRGAALDVLSKEPPPADNPLLLTQNCIVTPHNAWYSFEARQRIMETTKANISCALGGAPQNIVS